MQSLPQEQVIFPLLADKHTEKRVYYKTCKSAFTKFILESHNCCMFTILQLTFIAAHCYVCIFYRTN